MISNLWFLISCFWTWDEKDRINHGFWKVSLSSNESSLNEFAHQILSNRSLEENIRFACKSGFNNS
jgi:hypothetical protein